MSKILRSYHVRPDQDTDFAILSETLGKSKSELVREAIDAYLEENAHHFRTGKSDTSSR